MQSSTLFVNVPLMQQPGQMPYLSSETMFPSQPCTEIQRYKHNCSACKSAQAPDKALRASGSGGIDIDSACERLSKEFLSMCMTEKVRNHEIFVSGRTPELAGNFPGHVVFGTISLWPCTLYASVMSAISSVVDEKLKYSRLSLMGTRPVSLLSLLKHSEKSRQETIPCNGSTVCLARTGKHAASVNSAPAPHHAGIGYYELEKRKKLSRQCYRFPRREAVLYKLIFIFYGPTLLPPVNQSVASGLCVVARRV